MAFGLTKHAATLPIPNSGINTHAYLVGAGDERRTPLREAGGQGPDLAVDAQYQKMGIGRELIRVTQSRLGRKAKIVLLAAPKAEGYYGKVGFSQHRSAWVMSRKAQ